ncbi:hypothetical protein JCM14635_18630 [Megalodesulfovibrio paquesii]
MRRLHGLAPMIVGALILGVLIPLSAGFVFSMAVGQERIEADLRHFHQTIVDSLSLSVEDALLSFAPNEAENAAQVIFHDPRVLQIAVYSSLYDMFLVHVSKPAANVARPLTLRKDLVRDGEELGYVEIVIDRAFYEAFFKREWRVLLQLFAAMLACGLLILMLTFYGKVLRPIARLKAQAERLSAGELHTPCLWKGRDELAVLGQTLEKMRQELLASFQSIQELAVKDELTGLPNRRAFFAEASKAVELARRYELPLTVAIIDVDHFKRVNDTLGHAVGDQVLQEVARCIGQMTRQTDLFARIGGEEFAMCMPQTTEPDAAFVLERVRTAMAGHPFPHGLQITTSIGVAGLQSGQTLELLLARADAALYQAKHAGRNRVVLATD